MADGGLLAIILPVAWLTASQHRDSRHDVTSRCDVFEVWRLPRDMFNDARVPAAVVFAQKRKTAQRSNFAFRWLTAGASHRADFLDSGVVQFQSTEHAGADTALVGGACRRCGRDRHHGRHRRCAQRRSSTKGHAATDSKG